MRLIHAQRKPTSNVSEVVAHIQGVIWKHDLPPFRDRSMYVYIRKIYKRVCLFFALKSTSKRTRYLRQSISLTGLGTPTFNASLQGVLNVFTLFSNHVPRDALNNCENICNSYGNHPGIDISNRYFSSIKNTPMEKRIPFEQHEDPHGILARLETPNYVHSNLNKVEYFERISKANGEMKYAVFYLQMEAFKWTWTTRYTPIRPVQFNNGDIVEAQFLFLLVPIRREKFQLQLVLQGVTRLSNTFSQVKTGILTVNRN